MTFIYQITRRGLALVSVCFLTGILPLLAAPAPTDSTTRYVADATPAFTCVLPYQLNTYSIGATGATIYWYGSGYTSFEYRYKPTASATWTTLPTTQNGGTALTGLTPSTAYEWQVRSLCSGSETSGFTASTTFTTLACNAPQYASTDNITNTSARLQWYDTDRTNNYTVSYRAGTGAWQSIPNIPGNGTDNTIYYTLNGLTNSTAYQWTVQKSCTGTVSSPFSTTQNFTAACSAPTSVYASAVKYDQAVLNWSSFGPGTTYNIQYKAGPSGATQTITGIASATTSTTSYTLTGLAANTTYTVQVQTNCSGGVTSPYSTASNFTTQCGAPSLYSFSSSDVTYNTAKVQWYDGTNTPASTLYNVQYVPSSGGSPTTISNVTTPYTLTGLSTNVVYSVKVQAVCAPGITSVYSSGASFTTVCGTLDNYYPSTNNVGSRAAQLQWYDSDNSTTYEVQYRTVSPVSGSFQSLTGIVGGAGSYKVYSLTGLTNNTGYEWKVRKICGAVSSPTFTTPKSFTTQCGTPGSAYSSYYSITYNSAELSWYTPEIGTPHELQYQVQGTGVWQSVANITGSSSPYSYTLGGLAAGTTYITQVRAVCSGGVTSPFSGTSSFTTQSCGSPTSLAVTNITPSSAQLNWSLNYGYPAGTTTELSYAPVSQTASGNWTTVSSLTSTYGYYTYSLTGLAPNTDYAWRVRAFCSPTGSSTYTTGPTFRVECRTPDNPTTSNVNFNSAYLSWTGSSGQTYEVQWRQQGSTSAFNSATTTSTGYQLQNLSGSYEWKVRTLCGANGSSAFTALFTFTTVCNPPTNPYAGSISSYGALLNWNTAGNGVRYNIQYRPQSATTWTAINDIGTANYVLPGLTNGTPYEFQVQSVCSAGVSSTFSASGVFTTACSVPYVSASTSSPGQLNWTPSLGVGYVVEWKTRASTTWDNVSPVLNEGYQLGGYSSTSYYLTGLADNTVYDYRVKTICADGVTSAYTSVQSLTTGSCNAPVPTNHSSNPSFNLASLSWAGGTGGAVSELRWRPSGTTTWNTTQSLTSTYLTLRGLTSNTTYEWQVRNVCPAQASAFGPSQFFTTVCAVPTSVSALCLTNTTAYLDWAGSFGATYDVQWRLSGQTAWNTVSNLTSDFYLLTGLSAGTNYEFQVRTVCSATESSAFAGPLPFTTLGACPVPSYLNTSNYSNTCGSVNLYWGGCSGAGATYEVQYKLQSSGTWLAGGTTTSNTFTLSGLANSAAYDVQVRTVCNGGSTSAFITAQFVTIACTTNCTTPTGLQNSDITNVAGTNTWSASGSQSYEFRWRTGYTSAWNTTTTTNSSYRLTGLTESTPYDWQVRNLCTNGQSSEYSLINFFRTVCNIPMTPNSYNVGPSSVSLYWNGFGTGVQYEVRYRTGGGAWTTVSSIGAENYALTGLNNNTTYEWQVKTLCSGGGSSAFSHSQYFTTQCAAPTTALANFIDFTSVQLSWSGSFGNSYELQYRPVGGSYTTLSVGTVTSYTLTGLTNSTTYEWQVRTLCSGGTASGYPAQPLTFQTLGAVCTNMFSVKDGDWNDASVWSCGRIPATTDVVQIRHAVSVSANYVGQVQRINYTPPGRLILLVQSKIQMGL